MVSYKMFIITFFGHKHLRNIVPTISIVYQRLYYLKFYSRRCFQLQDFVNEVAITSLIKTYGEVKDGQRNQEVEVGARLTCHLLLMLFQTVEGLWPSVTGSRSNRYYSIKHRYVF